MTDDMTVLDNEENAIVDGQKNAQHIFGEEGIDEAINHVFSLDKNEAENDAISEAFDVEKIKFLETEQNLQKPTLSPLMIDENEPFSGIKMMGTILKEALDVRNYWKAMERMGEEVALYQWTYDEGKMGEFDAQEFSKEMLKAGVRTLGESTLNTVGSLLKIAGANMQQKGAYSLNPVPLMSSVAPQVGKIIEDLGGVLKDYGEDFGEIKFLAPSPDVYDEKPNFMKFANVIGSGASEVLGMTMTARFLGSKAAYGLFATQSAGEIFDETIEATGDVGAANMTALTNLGLTYEIDRIFNPLPKHLSKGAKLTAQEIAKETVGAPLREAGSEVLQQMLAENLVRKAGLDDMQDLFEGLVESAIGAFAGTSMVSFGGSVYRAKENYERARSQMRAKGVSQEELDLAEQGMLQFLEKNPQAFQAVLERNFNRRLETLKSEAKKIRDKNIQKKRLEEIEGFPSVYQEIYERAKKVLNDENQAKIAAAFIGAGAVSFYRQNQDLTPQKMIEKFLPKFEGGDYAAFLRNSLKDEAVSYMFAGRRAKGADLAALSDAVSLLNQNADPQKVWQYTGWSVGADDEPRFEISDKEAKLKVSSLMGHKIFENSTTLDEIHKLEHLRQQLSERLTNSANNRYVAYYKDFLTYLDNHHKARELLFADKDYDDKDFQNYDFLELIDPKDVDKRLAQSEYIKQLWDDYENKRRDFNEEEYQMIRTIAENRRYRDFLKKYGDIRFGRSRDFGELAQEKVYENRDNHEFLSKLIKLGDEMLARKKERDEVLDEFQLPHFKEFYQDLRMEEAYRQYVLFEGDLSEDIADRDFRPRAYQEAFLPKTDSERFLSQKKYAFLKEEERQKIAEYLDRADMLYRLDKKLEGLKNDEKMMALFGGEKLVLGDEKKAVSNSQSFRLGELLDHQALYYHYPELFDTTVEFKKLQDDAAYHFYRDKEKGLVIEADVEQLRYQGLKETLLKGAEYAIAEIEGFDKALSETDKRNFMDRQIYLAEERVMPEMKKRLDHFLYTYHINEDRDYFIKKERVPVALAGMTESRGVDEAKKDIKTFERIDYDKLENALAVQFGEEEDEHLEAIKKQAYYDLQKLKTANAYYVDMSAYVFGGFSAMELPWGGEMSQGTIDEKLMIERMNLSEEELRYKPFKQEFKTIEGKAYTPDLINSWEEYQKQRSADYKHRKQLLNEMAEGAYQYGTKTINLFADADEKTIIHESFHYFWDMLSSEAFKNDMNSVDFMKAMNDLAWEFVGKYKVELLGDKYYAINRKTGELMEEMPVGFERSLEATDAGIRELFVDKFIKVMNRRMLPNEKMGEAMDFYRRYLRELTGHLEIKPKTSGTAGQRILKFIEKKIEGGKNAKDTYGDGGLSDILDGMIEARMNPIHGTQYATNEYAGTMSDASVEGGENEFLKQIGNNYYKFLGMKESSNNYHRKLEDGFGVGAVGKYQFRKPAFQETEYIDKNGKFTGKNGIESVDDFLNSPEIQEKAVREFTKINYKYMERYKVLSMIGLTIEGIKNDFPITLSGMLAASHKEGAPKTAKYLKSLEKNESGKYRFPYHKYTEKDKKSYKAIETRLREFSNIERD